MPDTHIQTLDLSDITNAVRDTAILVDVTIAVWSAERTDKKIMEDAKAAAGATGNVGRAIKNLMSGADENLKVAKGAYTAVRLAHYTLTLPWVSDLHATRATGARLLPNALFDRYMETMGVRQRTAQAALDAFVAGYPDDRTRAQANLAGLSRSDDYPNEEEVRRLFRVQIDFEPIPAAAHFTGLPDATLHKLGESLERKQRIMLEGASRFMWAEVHERLLHLYVRLDDPKATFRDATVQSVIDLAALIPGWNVARDPRADKVAMVVEKVFGNLTAEALRRDLALRASTAKSLAKVGQTINAWGVVAQ